MPPPSFSKKTLRRAAAAYEKTGRNQTQAALLLGEAPTLKKP